MHNVRHQDARFTGVCEWCLAREKAVLGHSPCSQREERVPATSSQMRGETCPAWCALGIEKPLVRGETPLQVSVSFMFREFICLQY